MFIDQYLYLNRKIVILYSVTTTYILHSMYISNRYLNNYQYILHIQDPHCTYHSHRNSCSVRVVDGVGVVCHLALDALVPEDGAHVARDAVAAARHQRLVGLDPAGAVVLDGLVGGARLGEEQGEVPGMEK